MSGADDAALGRLVADAGDPWVPDNPYFAPAEQRMTAEWLGLVYPFIRECDFTDTLDLACGQGRNSTKLIELATRLVLIDVQPGNIAICRERFRGHANVVCHVGNGRDLRPVADASLTLVYCFDAMVHFHAEVVRSYLHDITRALKPGGRAFLHHSNYPGDGPWWSHPHSRATMTQARFLGYVAEAGLRVRRQFVLDWADDKDIDCLSLLEKP